MERATEVKYASLSKLKNAFSAESLKVLSDCSEIAVLEMPDGKAITLKVINSVNIGDRRIEIVTRPHKGLTAEQIECAKKIIAQDGYIATIFDMIPIPEYYLHCYFYGGPFTENIDKYPTPNFSIVLLDFAGTVKTYEQFVKFIEDGGQTIHQAPLLYRGPMLVDAIKGLVATSVLSNDGTGIGCIVIGEPIYHTYTYELMVFRAE